MKKRPVTMAPARISLKNLESLYARRLAIDALIRSLEDYDRFRAKRTGLDKRKTA